MRQEDTWNINLSNNHLIKIIEKQQTFNFFIERTEGIVKRERERERETGFRSRKYGGSYTTARVSARDMGKRKEEKKRKEAREEKSSPRRDPFESCVRSGLPSG